MIEQIISWFSFHYVETIASVFGMFSIYFGIKEKPFFWILATLNAILFVYVYFQAKMYAVMSLQFYYITVSIYGFYYWIKGNKKKKKVLITKIGKKYAIYSAIIFIAIYFSLAYILKKFTNSPIPFGDAIITTASIFAVFFMMKKYIENWYIWIVSDVITITILFSQHLYGAATLQFVYFIFAIIGLIEWKKSMKSQKIFI